MFKFKEADFWSIDYKALHKALVIYFKHHRKLSRLKNAIKNEGQVSWRRFVRGRLSFEDFKTFLYGMEAGGYFVIEELNEKHSVLCAEYSVSQKISRKKLFRR